MMIVRDKKFKKSLSFFGDGSYKEIETSSEMVIGRRYNYCIYEKG